MTSQLSQALTYAVGEEVNKGMYADFRAEQKGKFIHNDLLANLVTLVHTHTHC